MKKIDKFQGSWQRRDELIHNLKNALQLAVEARRQLNKCIRKVGDGLEDSEDAINSMVEYKNGLTKRKKSV